MDVSQMERRIVAIGGGTGLSTLLRGLKHRVRHSSCLDVPPRALVPVISDLTAIVAVTDDGGSSGRLRCDLGMLPPGDLRSCMVALADDEQLFSQLFRHRFDGQGELQGHSFGNLFIAALTEMTGDFAAAIRIASDVLAIRGRILPATSVNAVLVGRMEDGSVVRGETRINSSLQRIVELSSDPVNPPAFSQTIQAIADADLVTLGPGSLYTSLISNLLVDGIPQALAATRATRVYIANLMTEANESLGLSVAEHIERIYEHAGMPIFDYALLNSGPIPASIRMRYAAEGAEPVRTDIDRIHAMGIRCVTGNFVAQGDVLRHDSDRVTEALLDLPHTPRSAATNHASRIFEQILKANGLSSAPDKEGVTLLSYRD